MTDAYAATDRFLVDATPRFAAPYAKAIADLFTAKVRGNGPAALDARMALANLQRETMAAAEVYGASLALRRAARVLAVRGENLSADRQAMVRFASQTILPNVSIDEAIDDMIARTPVTIRDAAERTGQRIAQLYSEDHVVAFARSADVVVTKEARSFIARALQEGLPTGDAGRALAMSVNSIRERSAAWSTSYANTVFRTNVNTAVTAGRFRQAQDPAVRAVIPAFRFDSVGDGDTRHNHDAADGMILRVDNVLWNRIAPPLGYNCRCQVSLVSIIDLEDEGHVNPDGSIRESKLPAGAFPDEGFRHGGRPDLFLVGGQT